MSPENFSIHELRMSVYEDTQKFLMGLNSGASNAQLTALLLAIREKELLMIKQGGTMLSPEMWKLLHSRLTKRMAPEIIDTTY